MTGTANHPAVPLHTLPRRAARDWPGRAAVIADGYRLSFADLDRAVDRLAVALAGLLGRDGAVVGVPAVLTPRFAVLYYAVARSGNVVVTVNPFLRGDPLAQVLSQSGMRLLFLTEAMCGNVAAARASAPALHRLVLLEPAASTADGGSTVDGDSTVDTLAGLSTVDDLVAGVAAGEALPELPTDLDATAGIHFTSGTTGTPKGVLLSHRNLTVNAAQVAAAHGLVAGAVVVNHLPTYHLMHLNSAVHAGVTQVLAGGDDTPAALAAANEHGASRFYTLPVRLLRLAADPRLPQLRLDTVQAVMSGGSALPPVPAAALSQHFGIPVVQGYGLAETSPLTHGEPIDAPRTGSVGVCVPGTRCRIVDVESRAVLPAGERGEVQVRGPQVMRGYADPELPTGIDAEGWLSTGDIGYQDPDGYLFLVDRLKDVFKCDNWLVSPTEVEQVVSRHAEVAECVVVDHPHEHSGAVAHAFVVLAPGAGPDALDGITGFVNAQVPYYQRLHHITAVAAIPRSPNGKVARREIRTMATLPTMTMLPTMTT